MSIVDTNRSDLLTRGECGGVLFESARQAISLMTRSAHQTDYEHQRELNSANIKAARRSRLPARTGGRDLREEIEALPQPRPRERGCLLR